jgi:hypothetical protein
VRAPRRVAARGRSVRRTGGDHEAVSHRSRARTASRSTRTSGCTSPWMPASCSCAT